MIPQLIIDLALVLGLAAVTTLICRWLRQPVVLGYILAGYLAGNHFGWLPDVEDTKNLHTLAELGIIFLLFGLGLEFSFKKLLKVGPAAITAAITIIAGMMFLGFECGRLLGWSTTDSVFLAAMLSMSSTTIIFKAFGDLGLKTQKFASLVFGILIVEDLFAIIMMVVLSTLFLGQNIEGGQMVWSVVKLLFFLVIWLGVGLYVVPLVLEKAKRWLTREILLIVSLGMCLAMVVLANYVGFSSALGAFIMGSIFAETVEVKEIEKITAPIRDLFGAVFFVSVGMMVDPAVLTEFWYPILVITLVVIFGQILFATSGLLLTGQSIETAVKSSFSLVQIGEFAFIIATLGLSLGVISPFLYPVAVAVSVVTTFLTPFIIKLAPWAIVRLKKVLPKRFAERNELTANNKISTHSSRIRDAWRAYLKAFILNLLLFTILTTGAIWILKTYILPLLIALGLVSLPGGKVIVSLILLLALSPLLWCLVIRRVKRDVLSQLWRGKALSRSLIVFLYTIRVLLGTLAVVIALEGLYNLEQSLLLGVVLMLGIFLVLSRRIKRFWKHMRVQLTYNLRDKHVGGIQSVAQELNDMNIVSIELSADSLFIGRSMGDLQLRPMYGVSVVSIRRGSRTIVVPSASEIFMTMDVVALVGSSEDLRRFQKFAQETMPELPPQEMIIHQWWVRASSPIVGRTVKESFIRESYGCLVVAMCRVNGQRVKIVGPTTKFMAGDVAWLAGQSDKIKELLDKYK